MIDVEKLRRQARERAASRQRLPFEGAIEDRLASGVWTRVYSPEVAATDVTAYFAHGGYGIFGDLDLQDGYCRRLATALGRIVVSVDYRLAPEHNFDDAVDDLVRSVTAGASDAPVVLCGDSAGGAVAVAAATRLGGQARGLLLTNPNLDLTLRLFDRSAEDGPDWETSHAAFTAWVRPASLEDAPRLHRVDASLPPALVAVGSRDALAHEAQAFSDAWSNVGVACHLLVVDDVGHGFMGDAGAADQVFAHFRSFVDALPRLASAPGGVDAGEV